MRASYPGDDERIARMSIIQEDPERRVRMAHLAVVGSPKVNGVAELHSQLLAETTSARLLGALAGEVHQRHQRGHPAPVHAPGQPPPVRADHRPARGRWLTDLDRLRELEPFADDPAFRAQFRGAKRRTRRPGRRALRRTGITIDPGTLLDVMVKRLHEYKRQLLKLLHIVTLYHRIKADPAAAVTPRTVVFGAKAAPGYQMAKEIIQLINAVAAVVNADPAWPAG